MLTRADEVTLAHRIAGGDRAARDELILANRGLVGQIARYYRGRGLDLIDLIGEGNLGLIRAATEFDPEVGTRFSTCAGHWIQGAIRRALGDRALLVRLPVHASRLLDRWWRAVAVLEQDVGRPPPFDDVAAAIGLTALQRETVRYALKARSVANAFDSGADWPAPPAAPDDDADAAADGAAFRVAMDGLDDRSRAVVSLHCGLDGGPVLTYRQIADRLEISHSWARCLQARAVAELTRQVRKSRRAREQGKAGPP